MKAAKEKKPKTLEYKQSELAGLYSVMDLNRRPLNPLEKQNIENIEYGLEFRLKELVDKCKHEEIDMKIAAFKEVIAILKS